MPIFTILLVVSVFVFLCWLVQKKVEQPAKIIILVMLAFVLVIYLFKAFGLGNITI